MMDILKRLMAGLCAALLVTLTGWPMLPVQTAAAQSGCTELIRDGGFEAGDTWQLGATPLMPEYITYAKHGGDKSLVLGITRGGGKAGFSSAKQTITIPTGATKATLIFWANTMVEGYSNKNIMQLVLLHPDDSVLYRLWNSSSDSRVWNQYTFDMTRWRGRTIQVYFNVYNDGTPNTAGMFLDDVSLVSCPGAATAAPTGTRTATPGVTPPWPTSPPTRTPTPWPTRTATPTATPTYCFDLLGNGGFEADLPPWEAGPSSLTVQRVNSPVHGGGWALRLGTQGTNANSQSPVRQVIAVPPGSQRVTMRFWLWPWAESPAGTDRQEARIFAADGTLQETLWYGVSNNQAWLGVEADLTHYSGQTIQLLFNVYNDGEHGRAALFVDDASLVVCNPTLSLAAAPAAQSQTILWPDLEGLAAPTGPTSGVMRTAPSAVEQAGPPPAALLKTTRTALGPPPAPSVTAGPIPTIAPTVTATAERGRGLSPTAGQVLATWQSRWWVVVIALGLLTLLALALRR